MKRIRLLVYILAITILVYTFSVFALEKESRVIENAPLENEQGKSNEDKIPSKTLESSNENQIFYETHIERIGWQEAVHDGATAGTSGKGLRMEAIKVNIPQPEYQGTVEYKAYVEGLGWQNYVKNGEVAGTSGQSLRMEAIKIKLTGEMAEHYDVYYRVHVQMFGWLDWAKNDETAGTIGYSYRLEAIEIKLVDKNSTPTFKTTCPFKKIELSYETHIEKIGWQEAVHDGATAGTSGKGLRMEAIKVNIPQPEYQGTVEYKAYVEGLGWQNYVKNGEVAGTSGQSLRMEAIKIKLTGEMAEHYDVYYRVHVQMFGWLDWAKNDETAGTIGYSYRLEAIEIKLVNKGLSAPGETNRKFINRLLKYGAYQNNHWLEEQFDGEKLGIIGSPLNNLYISIIESEHTGQVLYSSYVTGLGWQKPIANDAHSNPETQRIEAIKIDLSGEISNYYDIYYSLYISNIGWSGWGKNGEACGNVGYGNSIQAIKVQLVSKNGQSPGSNNNLYQEDSLHIKYQSYIQNDNWQNYVSDGATSGTTGQSKSINGLKIKLNKNTISGSLEYSAHVPEIGWQDFFHENEQAGLIGKRIEAIRIRLTENLAQKYDVYYRVHVATVGWMGWAANGQSAGTAHACLGVEAVQIQLVEKGQQGPQNTDNIKTTEPYLEANWITDENGNAYYYDIFGNMLKGGNYLIGNTTYSFSPTGILLGDRELEIIDVSSHNGTINWKNVAESGIYGVIIRISASAIYEDKKLAENIAGVKKYNIPYGIYIYSYAENYTEGIAYANFTKQMINKYNINPTLGIFLDLESNNITQFMGTTEYTAVVKGFLSVIPTAELYTYVYYANTALNTAYMRNKITWIAHYSSSCGYTGSYKMWQYTSNGYLSGISGVVDKSKLYR